jgi:Bacterial Ig-like domain (group 2)
MIDHRFFRRLAVTSVTLAALSITLATCESLTAPKAEHVTLQWEGDTSFTAGTAAPVRVQVSANGAVQTTPRLIVTTSDTTVVKLAVTGDSLQAVGLGSATLNIQVVDPALPSPAPTLSQVVTVTPFAVRFARSADTVHALGDTITPSVTAFDIKNDSIAHAPFIWHSTDTTIIKVNSHGTVTSIANGTAKLKAVVSGDTATATVTVSQTVAHFVITPPFAVTMNAFGADTTLTAVGQDSLGSTVVGATPAWVLGTQGFVTITAAGVVQSVNNGGTWVYAESKQSRDSIQVTVNQVATRLLVTSPTGFGIPAVNGTLTLATIAFDRLNNPVTNNQPTLVSLNPSVAQVVSTTKVVTGLSPGSAPIVARINAIADTVIVQVANLPVKLTLTSHNDTIPSIGDTLKIRATLFNNLGAPVTGFTPFWYTLDTTVVSVSQQNGNVVALKSGATRVIAVLDTLADTATVTVTNAPATLRLLSHLDTLHSIGDTLTLPVNFRNSNGVQLPPTSATWSSDDPTVVRVSTAGMVTAIATGQEYVHAVSGILRDSALIVVTNAATKIVLNSTLDTMTARGQQIQYTATVTNSAGNPLPGQTVSWRSTNTAVASVDQTGNVTALTFGTTQIIASAGSATATVTVVVHNPSTNFVDNSSLTPYQFGTLKNPYLTIGAGVAGADPGDTVFVKVGSGPYSETVALNKQVTLVGDPTAYLANGRNATKLPLISHDTGTTAIVATSPAHVSIRTIAIRHTLDGPAIDARSALIQINQVFVNPSGDPFVNGRGISIQSTSAAIVDSVTVNAVHGYGLQLVNVINGRVGESTIAGVKLSTAQDSTVGAGIGVIYGSLNTVTGNSVRNVAGAQVLIDSSATATVSGNSLAGESQLMRLLGASNATVSVNTFNTRLQSGDTFTGTSATDGRSGLEINATAGVSVVSNSFSDAANSQMDFVRFINVRGSSTTLLLQNAMSGGRFALNSANSTWTLRGSHSTQANTAIVLTSSDTATVDTDTLSTATTTCVEATGTGGYALVTNGLMTGCGPSGTAAITTTASQGAVDAIGLTVSGSGQRAVDAHGIHHLTVRGGTLFGGNASCNVSQTTGAIDATADSVIVVSNAITGYTSCSAVAVAGGAVRVDSNFVTGNAVGLGVVGTTTHFESSINDILGNGSAGALNEAAMTLALTNNFWGDSLGPRRNSLPAAAGDTIIGTAMVAPVKTSPLFPGTRGVLLVAIHGDGQTATTGTPTAIPLVVRVVDQIGRPVSGVNITFRVTAGGGTIAGSSSAQVGTGSDGLSRATVTVGAGANTIVASAPGLNSVTFSASGD